MYFCYLDESGAYEPPDQGRGATPVMVVVGVIIKAEFLPSLIRDFLAEKRKFFPAFFAQGHALDHVLIEIKGSDILRMTRTDSRDHRRQADLFRSTVLDLLEAYGCHLIGRVWVKEPGKALKPEATYCFAVQDIAQHFGQFLLGHVGDGLLIADGRTEKQNTKVAHSIFTQKMQAGGDPYPPLLEIPVFGHIGNHVGLQLADLVASTLIFPMATAAYGAPAISVHSSEQYDQIRDKFGERIRRLQFRYREPNGRWRGGIVVSDPIGHRSGSLLFAKKPAPKPGSELEVA